MLGFENYSGEEVRLVSICGEKVNEVVSLSEAKKRAEEAELDLICINQQDIPVCIIESYEKYTYAKKKQQKEKLKSEKASRAEIKEIQFSSSIAENDILVKIKNAERILTKGDMVLLTIKYRGREIGRISKGLTQIKEFESRISAPHNVVNAPKIEGSKVKMLIAPLGNRQEKK